MSAPAAEHLLDAWDRGRAAGPVDRAGLLWTLCARSAEVADPTIGQRDSGLLALRTALFGDRMEALACCPSCGETWEVSLSAEQLLDPGPGPENGPLRCTVRGYDVSFRLPTHADLAAGLTGVDDLLARCLLDATLEGTPCVAADLPPEVTAAVSTCIADADPGADTVLVLSCDGCGTSWEIPFDTPSYLWAELDAWAHRVLREVHALASAYGWTEADVLALTPHRRRQYLSMVES